MSKSSWVVPFAESAADEQVGTFLVFAYLWMRDFVAVPTVAKSRRTLPLSTSWRNHLDVFGGLRHHRA